MKIHMASEGVGYGDDDRGIWSFISWHVIVYNELYKIIIMRYNKSVYGTKHK